jgi:DNA-directed RNA polymerase II subunit RPB11
MSCLPARQLLQDEKVLFAGYKMPHPLENHILVKIQTTDETSPEEAMDNSRKKLDDIFHSLETQFQVGSKT